MPISALWSATSLQYLKHQSKYEWPCFRLWCSCGRFRQTRARSSKFNSREVAVANRWGIGASSLTEPAAAGHPKMQSRTKFGSSRTRIWVKVCDLGQTKHWVSGTFFGFVGVGHPAASSEEGSTGGLGSLDQVTGAQLAHQGKREVERETVGWFPLIP